MALQQAGLQWVNAGLNRFISDTGSANRAIGDISDSVGKTESSFSALGSIVTGVATAVATAVIDMAMKAGKAIVGLAADSVALATEFESMTAILELAGAASADAAAEFGGFGELALAVGGDTRLLGVSATGAADAMTGLLKAGIPLEDVMGDLNGFMSEGAELGGVLRASIDLAAASELDMVEASDLAAVTLAMFGAEAEASGLSTDEFINKAMNNFVQAADASVASVSGLRDALVSVGPIAAGLGISLADTNNALAILSSSGIEGARAGTALRSMFSNMMREQPRVVAALEENGIALFDNAGEMFDLVEIIGQFEIATASMTDEQEAAFLQTVVGMEGMTAMRTLLREGAEGWVDMADATSVATTTQEAAERQAATLAGQTEALQGNIETLKIRIGSALLPVITDLTSMFSELVSQHGPAITRFFENIGKFATIAFETIAGFLEGGVSLEDLIPADSPLMHTLDKLQELFFTLGDWWKKEGPSIQASSSRLFTRFSAAGKKLVSKVLPFINKLITKFSDWWKENGPLISRFIQIQQERWGTLIEAIVDFWGVVEPLLTGLFDAILGIGTLMMQIATGDWPAAWETIQSIVTGAWETIQETFVAFANYVTSFFGTTWQGVLDVWAENWETFKLIVTTVWDNIIAAITTKFEEIGDAITDKSEEVKSSWENIWEGIERITAAAWNKIKSVIVKKFTELADWLGVDLAELKEWWMTTWAEIQFLLTEAWRIMQEKIVERLEEIHIFIQGKIDSIHTFWIEKWDAISAKIEEVWSAIQAAVETGIEAIRAFIETKVNEIVTFWGPKWTEIKDKVLEIWKKIKEGIEDKIEKVVEAISDMVESIKMAISDKFEDFVTLGENIVGALKEGIMLKVNSILGAIREMINKIIAAARGALQEASPSKKFIDIGHSISEGLAKGILDLLPEVQASIRTAVSVPAGVGGNIDQSRNVSLEINPTYENVQSPADIMFDVSAALAASMI